MDRDQAAGALEEADQRRRSGAEAVAPSPVYYLAICCVSVLWGASWDVRGAWRPLIYVILAVAMFGLSSWRASGRRRATPLRLPHRWPVATAMVMIVLLVAGGLVGGTLAVGARLHRAGVAFPFTLSGLLLGVVLCGGIKLTRRWYVAQVSRGRW